RLRSFLESLWTDEFVSPLKSRRIDTKSAPVCTFLDRQVRLATEMSGLCSPIDLDEYISHGGMTALRHVLFDMTPDDVLAEMEKAGVRGRGGAGFPTFRKWSFVRDAKGDVKYVVCNGDEGDPGAFMDRMLLESFPYRILEGMMIAAKTVGARHGFLYIRAEYPLAVRRVRAAIEVLEKRGFLGEKILGSDFSFSLEIKEGAGAFVCGEETALLESIEGHRGMPRVRPPFPAQVGLFGKPTLINNVETWALVPWIFRHGGDAFAKAGTKTSPGTKVFALAGKIQRGGLIEVPMGISIRTIVEEIGGSIAHGRKFKAVQIGGPSGGCVPAELADTPVDYESLAAVGAIMGSGGMVVLDEDDCMVDIARYFLQFTQEQSCGKCTFCRIGTRRMLEILERICLGKGKKDDLETLADLAEKVKQGSLCGLGKTAPNPVLSTLRFFAEEYRAHLNGICPAGKCRELIDYRIADTCNGCSICAQICPVGAIEATPYRQHRIDPTLCTRCDACRSACVVGAVEIWSGPERNVCVKGKKQTGTGTT
ncbi:MAG: NADH-ubiquinone oxidoreductase-F iron-sulfur binding region domain-containing protein, partial [Thermoguttaceae bacterium]|nr:NADH-ubiquinone oxidoreductase-F iron-sulfur binding region domain-containing protein [Thermoguttaceae bacterium]